MKHLKNKKGIALLIVMVIMAVSTLVVALLFNIKISDIKMNNSYEDYNRAIYVSEAGADLVINEWILYINHLLNINNRQKLAGTLNCNYFTNNWLPTRKNKLIEKFNHPDFYGNEMVDISYEFSVVGNENLLIIDSHDNNDSMLHVKVIGKYNKTEYVTHVRLQYCHHGDIRAYKGIYK